MSNIFRMEELNQPLVVIIDDDPEIRVLLRKLFVLENYEVLLFSDALSALKQLEALDKAASNRCSLIICDLKLPDVDGLTFIERVNAKKIEIPIVFVTAHASVQTAVEALKKGAFDYVLKPINITELRIIASRALEKQELELDRKNLKRKLDEQLARTESVKMMGRSEKIRQVFDLVERVAKSNSNVLITGESGTGKELVARSIHEKSSRRGFPFVAINCSAIPDQLLESELFGHKKGSFTGAYESRPGLFEEAEGGTIFLDEIGDMPIGLQAKLLRVLQERKVKAVGDSQYREINVRIIAASHKNIRTLIQEGKFREDLYYRICVIPIQLPPLRDRKEDIPAMTDFFIRKYCELNQTPLKKLTKTALEKLLRFSWPGNVRELENTIERAIVLSDQEYIEDQDLLTEGEKEAGSDVAHLFPKLLTLQDLERSYIQYVLQVTDHAKEKTAEILGVNRKTLYRKEIEYGFNSD